MKYSSTAAWYRPVRFEPNGAENCAVPRLPKTSEGGEVSGAIAHCWEFSRCPVKATLVAFGCHSCHKVSGMDLPAPTVQPPVVVALGGEIDSEMSDGYLVTAIINPSYEAAH